MADIVAAIFRCSARTIIANAFRKAAGIPLLETKRPVGAVVSVAQLDGLEECFSNYGSPMDGRFV